MPRRTERTGRTLVEKAQFHCNAIYNVPLRLYKTIDKFTFVFVPISLGNAPNPTKIKVTLVRSQEDRYVVEYVMVERKLKNGKTQRAIIDVRPVWIEGKAYDYYEAKEGFIEAYGETEFVNREKVNKWNQST